MHIIYIICISIAIENFICFENLPLSRDQPQESERMRFFINDVLTYNIKSIFTPYSNNVFDLDDTSDKYMKKSHLKFKFLFAKN